MGNCRAARGRSVSFVGEELTWRVEEMRAEIERGVGRVRERRGWGGGAQGLGREGRTKMAGESRIPTYAVAFCVACGRVRACSFETHLFASIVALVPALAWPCTRPPVCPMMQLARNQGVRP